MKIIGVAAIGAVLGLTACGGGTTTIITAGSTSSPTAPSATTTATEWTPRDVAIGQGLLRVNGGQFATMCAGRDQLPGGEEQFQRVAEKTLGGLIVQRGGDLSATVDYMISRC